jgi:hypothetical protein
MLPESLSERKVVLPIFCRLDVFRHAEGVTWTGVLVSFRAAASRRGVRLPARHAAFIFPY